jgi:hypothetical protein
MPLTFEFFRYRFHFRAVDAVHLPRGKSANVIRGAFGNALREAVIPAVYSRLFEPGSSLADSPSGLADWPRPFVLRTAHLDGLTVPAGQEFHLDAHVFELHQPALEHFRTALTLLAGRGLGPGRGRAELVASAQLDLAGAVLSPHSCQIPNVVDLEPLASGIPKVALRFLTPTELKSSGDVAVRPEFPILFNRLLDRISTLRGLYGPGPLPVDFRAQKARAAEVRLTRCTLSWERVHRRSGRTGQVHSIGGFTGEAEYEGDLREFLPFLRAAQWVGVGRQTVWGKGDVRVVE